MADKPRPIITPLDQQHWDLLRRHVLSFQQCPACGARFFPATPICSECGADDPEWVSACGQATLISWVVFHKSYFPGFNAELPYNVAIVRLDEGPSLVANVIGVDNASLRSGMPLEVAYEDVDDTLTIAKFRPAVIRRSQTVSVKAEENGNGQNANED